MASAGLGMEASLAPVTLATRRPFVWLCQFSLLGGFIGTLWLIPNLLMMNKGPVNVLGKIIFGALLIGFPMAMITGAIFLFIGRYVDNIRPGSAGWWGTWVISSTWMAIPYLISELAVKGFPATGDLLWIGRIPLFYLLCSLMSASILHWQARKRHPLTVLTVLPLLVWVMACISMLPLARGY